MNNIPVIIGQRIRVYRQKLGYTQEDLAEKADVHHTYIGQIERGEKNLTIITLGKILSVLDVSFSEFFECLDYKDTHENIASKSYEIINTMSEANQEKVYRLLCDINDIVSSK